jgi:hypothetical protein
MSGISNLAGTFPPSVPRNPRAKELAVASYLMQTGFPIIPGSKFAQSDGLLSNMPLCQRSFTATTGIRWSAWPYVLRAACLLGGHHDYRQSLVASRWLRIRWRWGDIIVGEDTALCISLLKYIQVVMYRLASLV